MAVPLSPDQILRKRHAIFYHQSQKDGVMFQGDDSREFWVRVEDRNRLTAKNIMILVWQIMQQLRLLKYIIFKKKILLHVK